MNQKKLEMAFKRYSKNFVDGIKFEDVKDKYNVSKNKIEKIVEQNETEKDHILLINLSKIFSNFARSPLIFANLRRGLGRTVIPLTHVWFAPAFISYF